MGHIDVIAQYEGDVNAKDSQGYTPLHKAIVAHQYAAVRQLLLVGDLDIDKESCGFTPLFAAALENGESHVVDTGARGQVVRKQCTYDVGALSVARSLFLPLQTSSWCAYW